MISMGRHLQLLHVLMWQVIKFPKRRKSASSLKADIRPYSVRSLELGALPYFIILHFIHLTLLQMNRNFRLWGMYTDITCTNLCLQGIHRLDEETDNRIYAIQCNEVLW